MIDISIEIDGKRLRALLSGIAWRKVVLVLWSLAVLAVAATVALTAILMGPLLTSAVHLAGC